MNPNSPYAKPQFKTKNLASRNRRVLSGFVNHDVLNDEARVNSARIITLEDSSKFPELELQYPTYLAKSSDQLQSTFDKLEENIDVTISMRNLPPVQPNLSPKVPALPHIDSCINNSKLFYHTLTKAKSKEVTEVCTVIRQKRPSTHQSIIRPPRAQSGFGNDHISAAVTFFDAFGDGNGEISLDEFTAAFRRCRRARATAQQEMEGRSMMKRLIKILEMKGLTSNQWFNNLDVSQGGKGDGRLTSLELKKGLQALTIDTPKYKFIDSDCIALLRYMDPNGDGDLTPEEVQFAFKRAQASPEYVRLLDRAGPIILRMERHMERSNMRLVDLFGRIDSNRDGSVSRDELELSLATILSSLEETSENKECNAVQKTYSCDILPSRDSFTREYEDLLSPIRNEINSKSQGSKVHHYEYYSDHAKRTLNAIYKESNDSSSSDNYLLRSPKQAEVEEEMKTLLNPSWFNAFDHRIGQTRRMLNQV